MHRFVSEVPRGTLATLYDRFDFIMFPKYHRCLIIRNKKVIRPPPEEKPPPEVKESVLDYGFFEKTCA
jgi:hypothetical protein